MYRVSNFLNNDDIKIVAKKGVFQVAEYQRDLSVNPASAMDAYFCNQMNIKKRQLVCDVTNAGITVQTGSMQWFVGDIQATTGIKSAGDFLKKTFRGVMSQESIIKPEYVGNGQLVLEPTYKYIILLDVGEWNRGIVLDDGLFLACESCLQQKLVARSNFSSALAGREGLFNLSVFGRGVLCLESNCPKEELIVVDLQNDVLKIDGNMAIAWSAGLSFTVERSGKTLIGSAASGEGLVNVYRGTGRVLLAPVSKFTPFYNNTLDAQQPKNRIFSFGK